MAVPDKEPTKKQEDGATAQQKQNGAPQPKHDDKKGKAKKEEELVSTHS